MSVSEVSNVGDTLVEMDRRVKDRRLESTGTEAKGEEAPKRRKQQRRRQIDPTTCERDYSNDEIAFMQAIDDYKRRSGRMFPTCSEILEVIRDMGYVRVTNTPGAAAAADNSSEAASEEVSQSA
ncbi:MAG: hypothetical protein ACTHK7_08820 [Aureliella sp.]